MIAGIVGGIFIFLGILVLIGVLIGVGLGRRGR